MNENPQYSEVVCDACRTIPISHLSLDIDKPISGWPRVIPAFLMMASRRSGHRGRDEALDLATDHHVHTRGEVGGSTRAGARVFSMELDSCVTSRISRSGPSPCTSRPQHSRDRLRDEVCVERE